MPCLAASQQHACSNREVRVTGETVPTLTESEGQVGGRRLSKETGKSGLIAALARVINRGAC